MRIAALLLFLLLISQLALKAQDLNSAQGHLDQLCSAPMSGRGYVDGGDSVAAAYIKSEFIRMGLEPLGQDFYHRFQLNVNTIPQCQLRIDGQEKEAGIDYVLSPSCPSVEIKGHLYNIPLELMQTKRGRKEIAKKVKKGAIPVLPLVDHKNELHMESMRELKECIEAELWVVQKENLVWSVARMQSEQAELWIPAEQSIDDSSYLNLRVEAEYLENYASQNVIAFIPGTIYTDSFIILCGHYDHLGKMGNAVYSGANDNASGIAMMLDMAKYFMINPQPYSIAFIGFAGEEAGLVGSYHFVQSPPKISPMDQIKFVFNMDLMGNGEAGATIVNATLFPEHFERLNNINMEKAYLPKLKKRGKAANSDHYFFSEAGVPSFFMYTMGSYTHYHIPQDNCQELRLGAYYEPCFQLIRDFILDLNKLN